MTSTVGLWLEGHGKGVVHPNPICSYTNYFGASGNARVTLTPYFLAANDR